MSALLRVYIESTINEMRRFTREFDRISDSKKSDEEMEEISAVASSLGNGGGFIMPLGYTNKDVKNHSNDRRTRSSKKS